MRSKQQYRNYRAGIGGRGIANPGACLFVTLLLLGGAATAQAQAAFVHTSQGNVYVEFEDFGSFGAVFDPRKDHEGDIVFGSDPNCPCEKADGHYHGFLWGSKDPDPDGCGHGCIWVLPQKLGKRFDKLDRMIVKNTKNPCPQNMFSTSSNQDRGQVQENLDFGEGFGEPIVGIVGTACPAKDFRSKMLLAAGHMRLGAETGCFSVINGVASGMVAAFSGALENGVIKKVKLKRILGALGPALLVAGATPAPGLPPPGGGGPPAAGECKVRLFAQMSSGTWAETVGRVGASVVTFERSANVQLWAEGKDPGGTYEWEFDYDTPDLPAGRGASNTFFSAMGSTARWMSVSARTITVTVTYTCPNGITATDHITLRVR